MQQQTPLSEELCTALMQLKKQDDKKVKKNDEDEGITLGGDVCNCRKSKCLKLYCQCFNAAKVCNFACHCIECCNTENHEKERRDAVKAILDRNPTAFDSKFLVNDVSSQRAVPTHKSGCRCRKSLCLKKYCECFEASVPCGTSCMCVQCRNTPDDVANANMGWANPLFHQPTNAAAASGNLAKVRDNHSYNAGTAVTGVAELAAAASALLASSSSCSSATFDRTAAGNRQGYSGLPISSKATNNATLSSATPTMMKSSSDADGQRFALLLQAPSIMGISSSGGPPSGVAMSHAPLHRGRGDDDDDGMAFVVNSRSGGSESRQHDERAQSAAVPRSRPPLPLPFPAAGNSRRDGTKRLHPDFNFHLQVGGLVVAGEPDSNDNNTDCSTGIDEQDMDHGHDNDNHTVAGQRDFAVKGVRKDTLIMATKGNDKRPSLLTRVVNKGGQGVSAAMSHSHYLHQTTPVGVSGAAQQGAMASAILTLYPPPAHAHASHHDGRDATTASDENDAAAASSATMNHDYPLPGDNSSSSSSSSTDELGHAMVGIDNRRCFDSGLPNKKARGAGSSFLRFASPNTISVASALSLLSRAPLAPAAADHADQHHVVQQAAES